MNRLYSSLLALLLAAGVFACSSPDDTTDPDPDAGTEDTTENDTDDADVDEGGCVYQDDCADGEYCHEGECQASPECPNTLAWQTCVSDFEEIDEDLARRAYCGGEFCRIACLTDQECPDGDVCTNDGGCVEFEGDLTGEHPGGDESQPLRAGVATTPLNFPVGMSLGGYGGRSGDGGRYGESLPASHGVMHQLETRGVALDDGQRQLVFLRAPLIFPSGALHEAVARILQDETGADWRSSLVLSGTHTHSGPARFWQLPDPRELDVPLGMLGIDEFHQQMFDWLVDSLADAALAALDDLSGAEMGWEVVESFDTDDAISSDRRGETPPFDDNRVLLIRIDDTDGNPRAVLVSFGTHGTVHSGPLANNDVLVGVEQQLEYALGDTYDRRVPVMYFNQNGGSMSPRGGSRGHTHTQKYQRLGVYLADRTVDAVESMETTDDWTFDGYTHRFPIVHEYLGYSDGEFRDDIYGGLMCPDDPEDGYDTHTAADDYDCGLTALHTLVGHRPLTLISKSQISAFQLNDLTLVTMPGELTMPLGWQVQRELRDRYDVDPFESFTWGYAQDHLLYLLPTRLGGELPPFPGISTPQAPSEYPEYAFSYLQGGYEANMSPWGHNLGNYLVDRAVEAVGLLLDESVEPEHPAPFPDQYTRRDQEPFPVETTDADDVGTVTEQPPSEVERRQIVEVAFIGGDPGAEMPQAPRVTLERQDEGGEFAPVVLPNEQPYDNREFTMITRLRRDDSDRPEWVVYWEETADFPAGTHRFHVDGHYLAEQGGEPTEYEATTDPFELTGSTAVSLDEFELIDATTVRFRVAYPPAEGLTVSPSAGDTGAVSGSYRMHHPGVPSGVKIPVNPDDIDDHQIAVDRPDGAAIGVQNVAATTEYETRGGKSDVPVTRVTVELDAELSAGDELDVDASITDVDDNTGTTTRTLEYQP